MINNILWEENWSGKKEREEKSDNWKIVKKKKKKFLTDSKVSSEIFIPYIQHTDMMCVNLLYSLTRYV